MPRYLASLTIQGGGSAGYYAAGTTPQRAVKHLHLLIVWHDARNGLPTWLAALRLWLHTELAF